MTISVSPRAFDAATIVGSAVGAIDRFDYVDGLARLVTHVRPHQIPHGAPLVVGGWVAARNAVEMPGIFVVVDGSHVVAMREVTERSDLTLHGDDDVALGYEITIPTDVLPPGWHELRTYVERPNGVAEAGSVSFRTYASVHPELSAVTAPVRIGFDQVVDIAADGSVRGFGCAVPQGRYVLLSGWAVNMRSGHAPTGVTATDGAGRRWTAPCALPRPDIQAARGALEAALGYEVVIATRALARGRHRVRIAAYRDDGAPYSGGVDAEFDVAAPLHDFPFYVREPSAEIEAAAELTTTHEGEPSSSVVLRPRSNVDVSRGASLTVTGWALAAGGRRAAEEIYLELSLDDAHVPPHRLAAVCGFRRDLPPPAVRTPPIEDAWFRTTFSTDGLGARTYRARLIVVERTLRSAASAELGTITVQAKTDQDDATGASGARSSGSRRRT